MPEPLAWQIATVSAIRPETQEVSSYTLRLPAWRAHKAGQHYDVRLTAADGYQAQRSYSIASPPSREGEVDLTIERIADGEVSPYFHDVVQVGDHVEVRGPIGGYFVWEPSLGGPLLLVAGGSGVVPLMAMLRWARLSGHLDRVRLVVSVRTPADLYYAQELPGPEVTVVHSRVAPPGATRTAGRLTVDDLAPALREGATAYVCGSTGFADAAGELLVDLGQPVDRIRVERFGATG